MKPRKTGNKPRREIQEIRAVEVMELRALNQKLKRENARLRRQLEKYSNQIEESSEEDDISMAEGSPPPPVPENVFKCPNCGGVDFSSLELLNKTFIICKSCKWRKQNKG